MAEEFYKDYDRIIRLACPDYEHCLDLIAKNVPDNTKTLLDLGSGTGNLILAALKNFPGLKAWGIELQPSLIDIAKQKTSNKDVSFIEGDILKADWPVADAITSSLMIHHLTHDQKADVFKRIYDNSEYFFLFDLIKGETEEEESRNRQNLYCHWERQGLSDELIQKSKKDMEKFDIPMKVSEHNELFEKIGFKYKLLYNKNGFAVYFCSKK